MQSESISELVKALVKVQAKLEGAKKDSINPHHKSKYANLESVWGACRDLLTSNGLAVTQTMEFDQILPHPVLVTTLFHTSGEYIDSRTPIISDRSGGPQGFVSGVTYMRRAALAAMIGIYQTDDDAEVAMNRDNSPAKAKETAKPGQLQEAKPLPPFDLWHRDIDAARRYAKTIKETLMAKKSVPPNQKDFLQYGIVKGFFTET